MFYLLHFYDIKIHVNTPTKRANVYGITLFIPKCYCLLLRGSKLSMTRPPMPLNYLFIRFIHNYLLSITKIVITDFFITTVTPKESTTIKIKNVRCLILVLSSLCLNNCSIA